MMMFVCILWRLSSCKREDAHEAPWFNQGAGTHWSSFNPDRARGYVLYRESSAGAHCFSSRLDALCRGALLPPLLCAMVQRVGLYDSAPKTPRGRSSFGRLRSIRTPEAQILAPRPSAAFFIGGCHTVMRAGRLHG